MLPKSVTDKLQENASKPSFFKSLTLGKNWKSESMRIIPEELVKSMPGAFEHRVVFSVRWGNSWQLWLDRDNKGLFMIEEDWDEFVDDNLLGPNDTLFFTHEDTMFFQVGIFDEDAKEITSAPLKSEPIQPKPQNSHQETTTASGTNGRAKAACATVENPERYLLNPENPYFVKTLTKKNDVLYVSRPVIHKYNLKFDPVGSTVNYILPEGKEPALIRHYGRDTCFSGWAALCRKHHLKVGDSVVCELERSGGLVKAVRLHFVNE